MADKIDPTIFIDNDGENLTVSKFNLTNLVADNKYSSFDEAIEVFVGSIKKPEKVVKDKEDVRISRQKEAIEKYIQQSIDFRTIGNLVFSNINLIEERIANVEEEEIIVEIDGHEVKILTSRSAQANASLYFDRAKE